MTDVIDATGTHPTADLRRAKGRGGVPESCESFCRRPRVLVSLSNELFSFFLVFPYPSVLMHVYEFISHACNLLSKRQSFVPVRFPKFVFFFQT